MQTTYNVMTMIVKSKFPQSILYTNVFMAELVIRRSVQQIQTGTVNQLNVRYY